jgi:hypothetical protein
MREAGYGTRPFKFKEEEGSLEEVGIDINDFDVEMLEKTLTGESEKVLRDTNELVTVEIRSSIM